MIPITLMMAVTADGKIAKNDAHFPDWTSSEDKKLFADISKQHKVLILGDKTFFTFPAPLEGRLHVVFTTKKNPPKTDNVMWVNGEIVPVLARLEKMGYSSALLGGGAFLNTQFLKKKLISEIILSIEPLIFGSGISLFNGEFNISLSLQEIKKINSHTLVTKYKVNY